MKFNYESFLLDELQQCFILKFKYIFKIFLNETVNLEVLMSPMQLILKQMLDFIFVPHTFHSLVLCILHICLKYFEFLPIRHHISFFLLALSYLEVKEADF